MRARAFCKWKDSSRIIGDLIRSPQYANSIRTWCQQTKFWLKTAKVVLNQSFPKVAAQAARVVYERGMKNNKSKAMAIANKLNFGSCKKALKCENDGLVSAYALRYYIKIKTEG